jgi:imidazolonepropionase
MPLLLRNIGQLATCPGNQAPQNAGLIDRAALLIDGGQVAWAGPEASLPQLPGNAESMDCAGRLVIPGLVDCHTHLAFGGWRDDEFEQRLEGRSYQQIAAAGGGIGRTVQATREADDRLLHGRARAALDGMLALGVTTVEAKSGYGLDLETELRVLELYRALDAEHPVDIVPTCLAAHVVPEEYADRREAYLDLVCEQLLPLVAERGLARFCDAFVETGAFSVDEGRRVLKRARELGLGVKVHADQLSDSGAAQLAAELGAISAEHLEYAGQKSRAALAAAGAVAVSLPLASLYLGERFLPARDWLEAGVAVAVASDFNPGSAPSYHLPLALLLACLKQAMTVEESLAGATSIAARALGLEHRVGSLLPAYDADLVLLDSPGLSHWLYHFRPNAAIRVMKKGAWVWERDPAGRQ